MPRYQLKDGCRQQHSNAGRLISPHALKKKLASRCVLEKHLPTLIVLEELIERLDALYGSAKSLRVQLALLLRSRCTGSLHRLAMHMHGAVEAAVALIDLRPEFFVPRAVPSIPSTDFSRLSNSIVVPSPGTI